MRNLSDGASKSPIYLSLFYYFIAHYDLHVLICTLMKNHFGLRWLMYKMVESNH